MGYAIALFAVLARLFCPTRGAHTSPCGVLRGLVSEARRIRSRRVRKFAETLPAALEREYLHAPERERTADVLRRADRTRLGVAVRREIAAANIAGSAA